MPSDWIKRLSIIAAAASIVSCSERLQGMQDQLPKQEVSSATDPQVLQTLRDDFLQTAGKDFVEFGSGSATLSSFARIRLERQAVWLRAYPTVSIRLAAGGDGMGITERRLAMARADAVKTYLLDMGVEEKQISGIDVVERNNALNRVGSVIADAYLAGSGEHFARRD